MNWFGAQLVSSESMLQAGLPFLEAVAAFLAIIAVFTLVIAVIHIILGVRSSDSHVESCPFGPAKGHMERFEAALHGRDRRF